MKSVKNICFFIILFFCVYSFSFCSVFASGHSGSGGNHSDNENYKEDPEGFNSWSLEDQIGYWGHYFNVALGSLFHLSPDTITSFEFAFSPSLNTAGYSSLPEFLAKNSSYDDNTMTWTFSDDAINLFNEFLNTIKKEENVYQYGYFCPVESIDVASFDTKEEYDIIHNVIQSKPDYAFSVWKSGITLKDSNGNNRIYPAWNIKFLKVPYAGVGGTGGSITTSKTTLFDDNWESSIDSKEFYVLANDLYNNYPPGGYDAGDIFYNNGSEFVGLHDVSLSDFDLNLCPESSNGYSVFLGVSNNYFDSPVRPSPNYMFSSFAGGIPIFKSVADMKTGTTGKQILQTMPGYTGQPITKNTISQTEINDFSTNYNYYYGNGSGNDPGGSGSGSGSGSSGNWLESLLGSLGKLGDIIMTLVAKVIDIITDILKFFTDTLADAMDIIPEGFIGFLGALFPFVPKEWLTAVSLALALMLIGVVVKVLKNIF